MNKIITILVLTLLTFGRVNAADVNLFGTIEQNVNFSDTTTNVDSGNSILGVKGKQDLTDDIYFAFKYSLGVNSEGNDKVKVLDAYGQFGSKLFGEVTVGAFKSFMRVSGDDTIDLFEMSSGVDTSYNARHDNAVSYITPTFKNIKLGVAFEANGSEGEDNADTKEYMATYNNDHLYVSYVHLDEVSLGNTINFFGAKYKWNTVTVAASYEDNSTSDIATVSGEKELGNNYVVLGYQHDSVDGSLVPVEVGHHFNPRAKVYAGYTHLASADDVITTGFRVDF